MSTLEHVARPADQLPGEAVAVFYFEDHKPLRGPAAVLDWRLDGQLTRALLDGRLAGRAGEHVVYQNNSKLASDWALFVGGGKWRGLSTETYQSLLRHLLVVVRQAGFSDLSLCLPLMDGQSGEMLTEMVERELDQLTPPLAACRLSLIEGMTG